MKRRGEARCERARVKGLCHSSGCCLEDAWEPGGKRAQVCSIAFLILSDFLLVASLVVHPALWARIRHASRVHAHVVCSGGSRA